MFVYGSLFQQHTAFQSIMPSHKNQHFVPRCYFKPFSLDSEGRAINLYNIGSSQALQNASVKGQCSKNYLYGKDLKLEDLLKRYEDSYGRVLRVLANGENLTKQDLRTLREFMILQYSRTEAASNRIGLWYQGIYSTVCESSSVNPPDLDLSASTLICDALEMFPGFLEVTDDLRICIVRNEASSDFITSDDPVFFTSRFYAQKLEQNSFGACSAGALFFLPLSPRLLLVLYDAHVYRAIDKKGYFISIDSEKDVYACNELQYINAEQNIYFSSWVQRDQIKRQFGNVAPRRQDNRMRVSRLVESGLMPGGRLYRQVEDDKKMIDEPMLIRATNLRIFPRTWLSKLPFRRNIRCKDTRSLAGYLREYTWENRHRFQ